jgi:hypothetical protein
MEQETTEYNPNRRLYEIIPPLSTITNGNGDTSLKNILGDNQFGFSADYDINEGKINYAKIIYQSPNEWETSPDGLHWEFVSNHGNAWYKDIHVQSTLETYYYNNDTNAFEEIPNEDYITRFSTEMEYIAKTANNDFGRYVTRGNLSTWLKDMLFVELKTDNTPKDPVRDIPFIAENGTAGDKNLASYFRKTIEDLTNHNITTQVAVSAAGLLTKDVFNGFMAGHTGGTSIPTLNAVISDSLSTYNENPIKEEVSRFLYYPKTSGADVLGTTRVAPSQVNTSLISFGNSSNIVIPKLSSTSIIAGSIDTGTINVDTALTIDTGDASLVITPSLGSLDLLLDGDSYLSISGAGGTGDITFSKSNSLTFSGETTINNKLKYAGLDVGLTTVTSFNNNDILPQYAIKKYVDDSVLNIESGTAASSLLVYTGDKNLEAVDGLTYVAGSAWSFTNGITIPITGGSTIRDWATLEGSNVVTKAEVAAELAGKKPSSYNFYESKYPITSPEYTGGMFYVTNDYVVNNVTSNIKYTNAIDILTNDVVNITDLTTGATGTGINTSVLNTTEVTTLIDTKISSKANNSDILDMVKHDLDFWPLDMKVAFYNGAGENEPKVYGSFDGLTFNSAVPIRNSNFKAPETGDVTPFDFTLDTSDSLGVINKFIVDYIENTYHTSVYTVDTAYAADIMRYAVPGIASGVNSGTKLEVTANGTISKKHKIDLYQYQTTSAADSDTNAAKAEVIFSPMSYSYGDVFIEKAAAISESEKKRFEDIFTATIANYNMYDDNDLIPKAAVRAMLVDLLAEYSGIALIPRSPLEEAEMINTSALTSNFDTTTPNFNSPSNDPLAVPKDIPSGAQLEEVAQAASFASIATANAEAAKAEYDESIAQAEKDAWFKVWQDAKATAEAAVARYEAIK